MFIRTILTLDDTLAKELKKRSAETGRSFKATVNDLLARGLVAAEGDARRGSPDSGTPGQG